MPLHGVYELLLRGLAGEGDPQSLGHISREVAYEELKKRTGQDFQYDLELWRGYIRSNRDHLGVGRFERI